MQQRVEQHKARQEALQAEVKHLKQATDEKQVQLEVHMYVYMWDNIVYIQCAYYV